MKNSKWLVISAVSLLLTIGTTSCGDDAKDSSEKCHGDACQSDNHQQNDDARQDDDKQNDDKQDDGKQDDDKQGDDKQGDDKQGDDQKPKDECSTIQCGDECCEEGYICDEFNHCMKPCAENETKCAIAQESMTVCCFEGFTCGEDGCQLDCGNNVLCDDVCCQDGEICEEGKCKTPCNGTRCGESEELCCEEGQACLFNTCTVLGKPCETVKDCEYDEFCEEITKTCTTIDKDPKACVVLPSPGDFKPKLQWHWPIDLPDGKPSVAPDYNEVLDTPIAINVTDDNGDDKVDENDIPDVIFSTRNPKAGEGNYYSLPGVVRVISGDDGHEIASSETIYYPAENLSAADIDGDGQIEIVATTIAQKPNRVDLLNVVPDKDSPTGYKLVVKASANVSYSLDAIGGMTDTSIADLDGDGVAEVVSNQGVLQYNKETKELSWRCQKIMGFRPIPVDLNGDGIQELVAGGVYDLDCNELIGGSKKSREYWAVADLLETESNAEETGELEPEIVRTYYTDRAPGKIEIWKLYQKDGKWSYKAARTADIPINAGRAKSELGLNCATSPTAYNCLAGGGAPVIADFDGDHRPDIGFASRWYYIVYSNKSDSLNILWADANIHDYSSAATGSSVFDFEGDGVAEVIYADEYYLRVYSGLGSSTDNNGDGYSDESIIYKEENSNGTLTEYPIIVDVDNDGSTEIVVASTSYSGAPKSIYGVRAFEDPNGKWVRTRRIWNQHNYFVTNINEDGTVPAKPEVNWKNEKLNNFRQNVQPSGMFNAPNLVAKGLVSDENRCTENSLQLIASVENQGSLGVKAGATVSFYAKNANGTSDTAYLGAVKVPSILSPGSQATVTFNWDLTGTFPGQETPTKIETPATIYFIIDPPTEDKQRGEFIECKEDDNQSEDLIDAKCDIIS